MTNESGVTTERSNYSAGGKTVEAFIARPANMEEAPAIIIIHEWWGLTEHIEDLAQRVARQGLIAVAPDLYHGVTTRDAKEAAKLMGALDNHAALADLKLVLDQLRSKDEVKNIGVTGFCMGGSLAMLLACNAKLEACAAFYGDAPANIDQLSCPLLFIGAEKDQWITVEKMSRLDALLKQHQKQGEVRIYKGADHAFFNDTRAEVYNPEAADDAWKRVIDFFNKNLRHGQAAVAL